MKNIICLFPVLLLLGACMLNPYPAPHVPEQYVVAGRYADVRSGARSDNDNIRRQMVAFCINHNVEQGMPAHLAANRCGCTYDRVRSQYTAAQWQRLRSSANSVFIRRASVAAQQCRRIYPH